MNFVVKSKISLCFDKLNISRNYQKVRTILSDILRIRLNILKAQCNSTALKYVAIANTAPAVPHKFEWPWTFIATRSSKIYAEKILQ